MNLDAVRKQVIAALSHPEAEEGLYFKNFYQHHEEDERPRVTASQEDILEALGELIQEGLVEADETGPEIIFRLA